MRTLSSALTSHLATRSHSRCMMLLLDLTDGTTVGVTDHDKALAFDIGDGEVSYVADTGILTSNLSLQCGLEADNYEVTGPITDEEPYRLNDFLSGRWNRARARLFQVNWKNLSAGAIKLLAGTVSEARIEGGKFVLEIRSDMDFYNQTVGRVITNQCDADFGDARCMATPVQTTLTVTSASDPMHMTGTIPDGPYANDYFNKGTVISLDGANEGVVMEIEDWTSAGAIVLFAPLVETPAVGDTFTIRQGCGKSRADCMARNNVINFRGYPEVPGSDQVLRMPVPGEGQDDN